MSLTVLREVDLSDHTWMLVVASEIGMRYEIHCDRCAEHETFDDEHIARRDGTTCPTCDCESCGGTGEVVASDFYGDDWSGTCDADITCPDCGGTGRPS